MATGGGVPGRLELVDAGQDFTVVVDYAHKPDAVAAAIAALRPLTDGRVIVVLGAGGERDPGKRPLMGAIAAEAADVLVVTDDNPRGEDPAAIRAELLAGTGEGSAEVVEIGDRRAAIREALARARAGDVVLVAGKGHETGQEVAGVVHPFDDREVSRQLELGAAPVIPMTLAEIAGVVGGEVVGDASVTVTGPAFRDNREPIAGRAVRGHRRRARRRPRLRRRRGRGGGGGRARHPRHPRPDRRRRRRRGRPGPAGPARGRRTVRPTVLALTGSQGKTGTKDYLGQVLAGVGETVATVGNLNNELGVPLTVLRGTADTGYLVVEMGARGIGHLAELCRIAPPDVAAVLNVGTAHLGEFGSREAIAEAKGELVEASGPTASQCSTPTTSSCRRCATAPRRR